MSPDESLLQCILGFYSCNNLSLSQNFSFSTEGCLKQHSILIVGFFVIEHANIDSSYMEKVIFEIYSV